VGYQNSTNVKNSKSAAFARKQTTRVRSIGAEYRRPKFGVVQAGTACLKCRHFRSGSALSKIRLSSQNATPCNLTESRERKRTLTSSRCFPTYTKARMAAQRDISVSRRRGDRSSGPPKKGFLQEGRGYSVW
jgi:hypothetical protein